MVTALTAVFNRSAPTLPQDALGCLALVVLLYFGLYLPVLV